MDQASQPLIKRPIAIRIPADRPLLMDRTVTGLADGRKLFGQFARK
jgi:hypothetical protein